MDHPPKRESVGAVLIQTIAELHLSYISALYSLYAYIAEIFVYRFLMLILMCNLPLLALYPLLLVDASVCR